MHEDIKIGDVVSLPEKNSLIKISGEVQDLFFYNDRCYIKIYSFFHRKPILYLLNGKGELVNVSRKKSGKRNSGADDIIKYDLDRPGNPIIPGISPARIISILLIFLFLFAYFPFNRFFSNDSYRNFLAKNYSFNELFYAVHSRINYRSDFDEYWHTPLTAWNDKNGDCEEMASIVSDYLNHQGIENYLAGLDMKGGPGHAVVFVRYANDFYIIDPTRALERSGVRKLDKAKTLTEAIRYYTTAPVNIYRIPSYDGQKEIVDTVY